MAAERVAATGGLAGFRGTLLPGEPMARHTSLGVGGPADLFAAPADLESLQLLMARPGTPDWHVVGAGFNLLVADAGVRGTVVSLEALRGLEYDGGLVRAWAGARTLELVRFAQRHGRGGLGFLGSIPGSVGGALAMNAGTQAGEIMPLVARMAVLRGGAVTTLDRFDYGYRRLSLQPGDIILHADLALPAADPAAVEAELAAGRAARQASQQVGLPSAGSFFKNPPGHAAWRLIDDAGQRGRRVGGALVSPVHCNFLVNAGGATAADFLALAAEVKAAVFARSGVALEEEVRFIGAH